jgi:hypothetical protein
MSIFSLSSQSNAFEKRVEQIRKSFAGKKPEAKFSLPGNVKKWVMWQEFGTAKRGDSAAASQHGISLSGQPYPSPRNPVNLVEKWTPVITGKEKFSPSVNHYRSLSPKELKDQARSFLRRSSQVKTTFARVDKEITARVLKMYTTFKNVKIRTKKELYMVEQSVDRFYAEIEKAKGTKKRLEKQFSDLRRGFDIANKNYQDALTHQPATKEAMMSFPAKGSRGQTYRGFPHPVLEGYIIRTFVKSNPGIPPMRFIYKSEQIARGLMRANFHWYLQKSLYQYSNTCNKFFPSLVKQVSKALFNYMQGKSNMEMPSDLSSADKKVYLQSVKMYEKEQLSLEQHRQDGKLRGKDPVAVVKQALHVEYNR